MGYIKLDRRIQEWGWFDDPLMLSLWIHLLLKANWGEKEWHGETIPRGSFVTSASALAAETGISKRQVIYCLSKLKAGGEVEITANNRFSVIRIVKYSEYQSDTPEVLPETEPQMPAPPAPQPEEKPKAKRTTPKPKEPLNLPFNSDSFLSAWEALCREPKWKGKSSHALQLSLNKLAKYDEAFAIKRIYLAIERNWQGVVFDDTDKEYAEWLKENQSEQPILQQPQEQTSMPVPTEQQHGGFTVAGYKRTKK